MGLVMAKKILKKISNSSNVNIKISKKVKSSKKGSSKSIAKSANKNNAEVKAKKPNIIHRLASKIKANTKKSFSSNPDTILTTIPKALQKKIDEVIKLTIATPGGFSDLKHLANKILEHAADISSNLKKKIK